MLAAKKKLSHRAFKRTRRENEENLTAKNESRKFVPGNDSFFVLSVSLCAFF